MPAVLAHVFGVTTATCEEPDAVRGEEADQRMANLALAGRGLEETVAAVAGILDEPVSRRHRRYAMPEQAAGVSDLLGEPVAVRKTIGPSGKHQRMAAAHAHVFMDAIPIRQADVDMVPQKARQRVAHVRRGAVLWQVLRTASAAPHRPGGATKHLVVHDVPPYRAAQPGPGRYGR